MTTRRLRHLLYGTATGLALAAMGVVVYAVSAPPGDVSGGVGTDTDAAHQFASASPNTPSRPDRDALLALAQQPLRQQLFDPPPTPPVTPPPPPPLPGVELISTVLPSHGEPSAWVREPAQSTAPRKVRVGDVLGPDANPATITAIEPDRLLVEHNGETKPIERNNASGGRR